MYNVSAEKITAAKAEFGDDAVYMALEMTLMSDPDGAYTLLEDTGQFKAAEAVEFLFFRD
jgi:hypothetical protein